MTARLPLRRRDDAYLETLRCETAAVLYHACKGIPKKVVAAATGRGREYVERQVLGLDPNDLEMICRRVECLLEQGAPEEQAKAEVLYLAEAYLWRADGEEISLPLANRLVSALLRSTGSTAEATQRALDDGSLDARERTELNQLLDQLESAATVLRRAINARGAEPSATVRPLRARSTAARARMDRA